MRNPPTSSTEENGRTPRKRSINEVDVSSDATDNVSIDLISNPKRAMTSDSSTSPLRCLKASHKLASREIIATNNALHSLPQCQGTEDIDAIQEVENLPGNYKWEADVKVVNTCMELLEIVDLCKSNKLSLRVKASGWSCNKFLDPSKSDNQHQNVGMQIILGEEFKTVLNVDDSSQTITAGAATQRQAIYAKLNEKECQLRCSGECFTTAESQEIGGLIANAVHDTMQESFSPETVHSLKAVVFGDNGKATVRSFSKADKDDFFAFFGGMGMTGIIVSATLKFIPKKYYQYRPYLPGKTYDDDESFKVHEVACDLKQLIKKHHIMAQGEQSPPGLLTINVPENGGMRTYKSTFANALKDLSAKHKDDKDDVVAMFFLFPTPEEEEKAQKKG